MDVLADAFRTEWADPLASAAAVVSALRSLTNSNWAGALARVQRFRHERADSALLLAVTDPAVDPDIGRVLSGLETVDRALHDTRWIRVLASLLMDRQSIGVPSLGDSTLAVLELAVTEQEHDLVTDTVAVARGLGYLDSSVLLGPPEASDVVLVPAAAGFGDRIWTTARIAGIAERAIARSTPVLPVLHPLNVLSPLSRRVYRPASMLIDVDLGQRRSTT
ncbi:MAG: hypothetical protein WAM81_10375 [Acidimicrobiia bacterium]